MYRVTKLSTATGLNSIEPNTLYIISGHCVLLSEGPSGCPDFTTLDFLLKQLSLAGKIE